MFLLLQLLNYCLLGFLIGYLMVEYSPRFFGSSLDECYCSHNGIWSCSAKIGFEEYLSARVIRLGKCLARVVFTHIKFSFFEGLS